MRGNYWISAGLGMTIAGAFVTIMLLIGRSSRQQWLVSQGERAGGRNSSAGLGRPRFAGRYRRLNRPSHREERDPAGRDADRATTETGDLPEQSHAPPDGTFGALFRKLFPETEPEALVAKLNLEEIWKRWDEAEKRLPERVRPLFRYMTQHLRGAQNWSRPELWPHWEGQIISWLYGVNWAKESPDAFVASWNVILEGIGIKIDNSVKNDLRRFHVEFWLDAASRIQAAVGDVVTWEVLEKGDLEALEFGTDLRNAECHAILTDWWAAIGEYLSPVDWARLTRFLDELGFRPYES